MPKPTKRGKSDPALAAALFTAPTEAERLQNFADQPVEEERRPAPAQPVAIARRPQGQPSEQISRPTNEEAAPTQHDARRQYEVLKRKIQEEDNRR